MKKILLNTTEISNINGTCPTIKCIMVSQFMNQTINSLLQYLMEPISAFDTTWAVSWFWIKTSGWFDQYNSNFCSVNLHFILKTTTSTLYFNLDLNCMLQKLCVCLSHSLKLTQIRTITGACVLLRIIIFCLHGFLDDFYTWLTCNFTSMSDVRNFYFINLKKLKKLGQVWPC